MWEGRREGRVKTMNSNFFFLVCQETIFHISIPRDTPIYELYRYAPHFRVWFSNRFSLK